MGWASFARRFAFVLPSDFALFVTCCVDAVVTLVGCEFFDVADGVSDCVERVVERLKVTRPRCHGDNAASSVCLGLRGF